MNIKKVKKSEILPRFYFEIVKFPYLTGGGGGAGTWQITPADDAMIEGVVEAAMAVEIVDGAVVVVVEKTVDSSKGAVLIKIADDAVMSVVIAVDADGGIGRNWSSRSVVLSPGLTSSFLRHFTLSPPTVSALNHFRCSKKDSLTSLSLLMESGSLSSG